MKFFFLCFLLSFGHDLAFSTATSDAQLLYHGFTAGSNLTVDDAATVMSNGLLELTNGSLGCKGHAFYPTPLHFRETHNNTVQSFSAAFIFAIRSSYPTMSRQGLAFIVAPSMNFSSALANQYLGFLNSRNNGNASNHIFAIELDTVLNIEFQDINTNHIGIDINDLRSIASYPAGYYDDRNGSFQNMSLTSGDAMQVWVDYNGEAKKISVTMAPLQMAKPTRPLVSADYDLSTVLQEPSYIGLSSSAGEVDTKHYVLGWSFGMNKPAPVIDIAKLPELPRPKHQTKLLEITLPLASAAFVFVLGSIVILIVRRKLMYTEVKEDWEIEFGPHRFSYKDLFHATEGFKSKHLIGAGGFGKVYKGTLPSTKLDVAVKKVSHGSSQGLKEFVAEVASIGRIRHRNLVQLLGYCRRKSELLLVYDHMLNGSLDKYLYCDEQTAALNWARRFQIIKDIASGLFYLHEKWEKVVIHRDVKASNVLLDSEMNGRLGDFGLARLYDHGTDMQTTHVVGTIGYLAPELVRNGKATPLTDVFAFGMFLLEVACGRRPVDNNTRGAQQPLLVDWVLEHWNQGSLTEVVDARLQGDYNVDQACLVLQLGLLCAHPFPNVRPNMQSIMGYLDGDSQLPELTDTDMSFSMLAVMQGEGFDAYALPYLSSKASIGTLSGISVGR